MDLTSGLSIPYYAIALGIVAICRRNDGEDKEIQEIEKARGILAIWHDVATEDWEETLAWYDREHHAERVDIPGFLSARRYVAVDARPRLFIRYETEGVDVLSSDAYLERVNNPTPWSLARQPTIINNSRTVCRVVAHAGHAEGGLALTLRLTPREQHEDAWHLLHWERLSGELLKRWGILAAELWTADLERTSIPSSEKRLRATPDAVANVVLVVHATEEAPLREALATDLHPARLGEEWEGVNAGLYRLAFSLARRQTFSI
jgi:hypothetical protein